ncbi:multidrug effflux MFS transporter [Marivivens aquimaris]|uniref:multidrug effflux MFS transporter n=1 Tax=Marivivens aquimaris TaxID=2774876 RepID=UPI002AD4F8EA|nr:multidrug effflux MFS transporter [Marivivens aquimaris]
MTAHREPASIRTLATLAILLGFASISTDLFLPALPAMAADLNAPQGQLELVVSTYLFGFGFGQLLWGPVSDRFGRRGPILIGVMVFVLGSAGCALATEAWHVILWRVVQALGASAGVALARAMVRDLYERDRAAKVMSGLMMVMAIAPLVGPTVGAQILAFASWQAIFWTLVALGIGVMLAVAVLPESLPIDERSEGAIWHAFRDYGRHFRNRALLLPTAALGFYYTGVFGGIAGAPFAFISYYELSPQAYALVFASGVFGLLLTNAVNVRLVVRLGSERMLLVGAIGAALSGALMFVVTLTGWQGALGLIAANFLFMAMNGLITANAVAGALAGVRQGAGSASAVVGAIQYGSGMIGAALVSGLANGTPVPMGVVIVLSGIGCLICAWLARK